jgi:hypothetical protein
MPHGGPRAGYFQGGREGIVRSGRTLRRRLVRFPSRTARLNSAYGPVRAIDRLFRAAAGAPVTPTGPDLSGAPADAGRVKIGNDAPANRPVYLIARCNDSFTADLGKIDVTATLALLARH